MMIAHIQVFNNSFLDIINFYPFCTIKNKFQFLWWGFCGFQRYQDFRWRNSISRFLGNISTRAILCIVIYF